MYDVIRRYVWDSKDNYIRKEGTVKVCIPLVNRGDKVYSEPVLARDGG